MSRLVAILEWLRDGGHLGLLIFWTCFAIRAEGKTLPPFRQFVFYATGIILLIAFGLEMYLRAHGVAVPQA